MGGRRSGSKPAASGAPKRPQQDEDHLPPPSTLAARLVREHAPETRRSTRVNDAEFAQLIDEILHNDAAPEEDPQTNYQAICVVVHLGLDVLSAEDPFADASSLLDQAKSSLAVIGKTITRQPEILFFTSAESQAAPLVIWLLSRLLKAAIQPKYKTLQPMVAKLLGTFVQALQHSLAYWQYASPIISMFRDALDDIVDQLEAQPCFSTKAAASFDVEVPAARSITLLCSGAEVAIAVPSDVQTTVKSLRDAVDIAQVLVGALSHVESGMGPQRSALSTWKTSSAAYLQRTLQLNGRVIGFDTGSPNIGTPDHQMAAGNIDGASYEAMDIDKEVQADGVGTLDYAAYAALHQMLSSISGASAPRAVDVSTKSYAKLSETGQERFWLLFGAILNSALSPLHDLRQLAVVLEALTTLPSLKKAPRNCILAARAIQSLILQTTDEKCLALDSSNIGKWCIRLLTNQYRETRFAAVRALTAFLRGDLPSGIRDTNRRGALTIFKELSDRSGPRQHDTAIYAWRQVAVHCGETERLLALLQLVEYLGNGNPLLSGLASCELDHVAQDLNLDPQKLFRPYWHSIAIPVLKDLMQIPQKAGLLAEFLRISVDQLLVSTQVYTIPYLIWTKRKEALKRIAMARTTTTNLVRGPEGRNKAGQQSVLVQEVILQPRSNLSSTLSYLFCQSEQNIDREAYVTAVLLECVPDWTEEDVSNLFRLDPAAVVAEMLKMSGDLDDESKKPAIFQAIQDFAVMVARKGGTVRTRPAKLMETFFQEHVLGIMTQLSNIIERNDESALGQDKVRCLRGIDNMLHLGRGGVGIALPQIRACLQSAIDQGGLIDHAIAAWLALLDILAADDIVHLLGHFFSIVVQHWSTMSDATHRSIYNSIGVILKTHSDAIRDDIIMIPSLSPINLLCKFEVELSRHKDGTKPQRYLEAFVLRLQDENATIVLQAANELLLWLEDNQNFIHEGAISEPPVPIVVQAAQTLLSTCAKYNSTALAISDICGRCLGVLGCLDRNKVEPRDSEPPMLIMSNFDSSKEVLDWVVVLFKGVLEPAFKSATNAKAQGFLAWVMQELLRFAKFENVDNARLRSSQVGASAEVWLKIPESTRNTLVPFLYSNYVLSSNVGVKPASYPIFGKAMKHGEWLRRWVYDLSWRAKGDNAKQLFKTLARVVNAHDANISKFLLPYVALNVILGGTTKEVDQVAQEMFSVLSTESSIPAEQETLRQCSEDVFSVLDYMTRWVQERKRSMSVARTALLRAGHPIDEEEEITAIGQIQSVEKIVSSIPANIIAQRAIECGSYTRALYHWENFIREQQDHNKLEAADRDAMYLRLQSIYSEIDEPDGLDGIASRISILSAEQQAWQHLHTGRWTAAHSWYEFELMSKPHDCDVQKNLLTCLQQSGQANQVIRLADSFSTSATDEWREKLLAFKAEAAWSTANIDHMRDDIPQMTARAGEFNVMLSKIILDAKHTDRASIKNSISTLRSAVVRSISPGNADSLSACHVQMLQLHILQDIQDVVRIKAEDVDDAKSTEVLLSLDRRLAVLGSSIAEQQQLLAIRRTLLKRMGGTIPIDTGKLWTITARLARKANLDNVAHFAVISAAQAGDEASKIEQARLMWKNGRHRQAISNLQGAIDSNAFANYDRSTETTASVARHLNKQNMMSARAQLLLAKWLDASGQTQTHDVSAKYQFAARNFAKWEKGHYYLGKHYNKLLEAEKALPANKQSEVYLTGEFSKLVIENFLRSIPFGSKYWYQTIPKLITLWLDLGMDCVTKPRDLSQDLYNRRVKFLEHTHGQLKKYYDRVPRYIFYTALPQLISRISHPHAKVADVLSYVIMGVVSAHPQQGLWALIPVTRATSQDRASRGTQILTRLRDSKPKTRADNASLQLRTAIMQGQKLQDGLLNASEVHLESRTSNVSLARDLGFNHKLAPNPLVIPFQHALTPNIPTIQDSSYIRSFKAFPNERVEIASFSDDVLVLNSLQRPRKLTLRGSDGKTYSILCKPKDDLRKDQRLMEFNTMINRSLKRSPASSRRRLYIKTYGVTPLSEESGTIEWVEGIKPLRDILLKQYTRKGITPNYTELRAILSDAASHPNKHNLFSRRILPQFPPVLHEWFTESFPSPAVWFDARTRYARTCAVMSMVGHVLGLGDRHGENILLQESNGGVFHVDFNCLFDKGLTFEKPELVPFRLTHNMVDAMGPVLGVEGPFRVAARLTLNLLREGQDGLMNVLETFLHDPTTDFVGRRKRAPAAAGGGGVQERYRVPETPREVLDSVRAKLNGFLRGESVPLSVEGMVQALIGQATDEGNLCQMYIGWCAFL